ncbi:hypothetical protein IAD21_01174 [Abditibacteriota bacterium]|nr:hypothetical protein IAD21_01174 [Abditibacteriota bacterium]
MNPHKPFFLLLLGASCVLPASAQDAVPPPQPPPTQPDSSTPQTAEEAPDNANPATPPPASDGKTTATDGTASQNAGTSPTAEDDEQVITIVRERSNSLLGQAKAASEGVVGPRQLERRPILRPGELLETVPGVIITQHSGSGKANQYFLRGYNLDHGTDLAVSLDGIPLNLPTHAHGQGYIDLNLLIPELVSQLRYRKGSYEADQGDFSSAGSIDLSYARHLGREDNGVPQTQSLEVGAFGFQRVLVTGNANKDLLYALELQHSDSSFELKEDFRKLNGVLRFNRGTATRGVSVTGLAYNGKWNSSDQIPLRTVDSGLISRFGNIDPTDGGKSRRFGLAAEVRHDKTNFTAYAMNYRLNLFSNFTYFLDNPTRGDQFEQEDRRNYYGFHLRQNLSNSGARVSTVVGVQGRYDDISGVGLFHTQARERFETVREDRVKESSVAPYVQSEIRFNPKLRATVGARFDYYRFDVASSIAQNSGKVNDSLLSPKGSLAYRLGKSDEGYFSLGRGFHSNDARGTTITVDPNDPNVPADRVTPLVKANFVELGLRHARGGLQSTLALFGLDSKSELVFVGDAGTTEPSRPSRRIGVEFTNYLNVGHGLIFDADFAYARARFRDSDPAGNRIPGALEGIVSLGASYERDQGINGALRLRYFGPRPLIEDNSVRSKSSALVNGRLGYKLKNGTRFNVEVFNIFNAAVSDIDYYYASRLPGEGPDGVEDIHFHPSEKRSIRVGVVRQF